MLIAKSRPQKKRKRERNATAIFFFLYLLFLVLLVLVHLLHVGLLFVGSAAKMAGAARFDSKTMLAG